VVQKVVGSKPINHPKQKNMTFEIEPRHASLSEIDWKNSIDPIFKEHIQWCIDNGYVIGNKIYYPKSRYPKLFGE
jgi:hypothetical protein